MRDSKEIWRDMESVKPKVVQAQNAVTEAIHRGKWDLYAVRCATRSAVETEWTALCDEFHKAVAAESKV